jgi:hypothetical protein
VPAEIRSGDIATITAVEPSFCDGKSRMPDNLAPGLVP